MTTAEYVLVHIGCRKTVDKCRCFPARDTVLCRCKRCREAGRTLPTEAFLMRHLDVTARAA